MVMNVVRQAGVPSEHLPIEGQATYGRSNLRTKDTGLPFIVFISQRDDARHAARVKWSLTPRVTFSEMGSYSVEPFEHKAGERLPHPEEMKLKLWVGLNKDVLLGYWDGDIEYTQDAIERLKSIET